MTRDDLEEQNLNVINIMIDTKNLDLTEIADIMIKELRIYQRKIKKFNYDSIYY